MFTTHVQKKGFKSRPFNFACILGDPGGPGDLVFTQTQSSSLAHQIVMAHMCTSSNCFIATHLLVRLQPSEYHFLGLQAAHKPRIESPDDKPYQKLSAKGGRDLYPASVELDKLPC